VFCGSVTNKGSAEHLFHRSWADRIPHSGEMTRTDYSPFAAGESVIEIPRSVFDQTVTGVCKRCNESWMNDADMAVEGFVVAAANGLRRDIPGDLLVPLSKWAVKVALMRSWVNRSRGWEADHRLFRALWAEQLPPVGTVVHVALSPKRLKEGGSNSMIGIPLGDDRQANYARLTGVCWGMGALFTHVLLPGPDVPARVRNLATRAIRRTSAGALYRVWPSDRRSIHFGKMIDAQTAARIGNLNHLLLGTELRESDV